MLALRLPLLANSTLPIAVFVPQPLPPLLLPSLTRKLTTPHRCLRPSVAASTPHRYARFPVQAARARLPLPGHWRQHLILKLGEVKEVWNCVGSANSAG